MEEGRKGEGLRRRFRQGRPVHQAADEMGVVVRRVEQMQTAALRALDLQRAARGAKGAREHAATP